MHNVLGVTTRKSIWHVEVKPGVGAAIGVLARDYWGLLVCVGRWHQRDRRPAHTDESPDRLLRGSGVIAVLGFAIDLLNTYVRQPKPLQIGDAVLSWQAAEQLAAAHMRVFGSPMPGRRQEVPTVALTS